jgi:hypothetical protein
VVHGACIVQSSPALSRAEGTCARLPLDQQLQGLLGHGLQAKEYRQAGQRIQAGRQAGRPQNTGRQAGGRADRRAGGRAGRQAGRQVGRQAGGQADHSTGAGWQLNEQPGAWWIRNRPKTSANMPELGHCVIYCC